MFWNLLLNVKGERNLIIMAGDSAKVLPSGIKVFFIDITEN